MLNHLEEEVGEESSSDSPGRISCSSPRSGRSRIKVDVLRLRSPPEILIDPSSTGKMKIVTFHGRLTLLQH